MVAATPSRVKLPVPVRRLRAVAPVVLPMARVWATALLPMARVPVPRVVIFSPPVPA